MMYNRCKSLVTCDSFVVNSPKIQHFTMDQLQQKCTKYNGCDLVFGLECCEIIVVVNILDNHCKLRC